MLEKLFELKKSLENNWTYLHKILFTFSFYLLYKGFLKVLSPEQMSPFILIFLILGFLIFTIDILIYPVIDIFTVKKPGDLDKETKVANRLAYLGLIITLLATVAYYTTHYYPLVIIIFYSLIMSVLSYAFFMSYCCKSKTKIIKLSILILSVIGIAGIAHSIYLNKALNINTFTLIFILGFFIIDFLVYKWRIK